MQARSNARACDASLRALADDLRARDRAHRLRRRRRDAATTERRIERAAPASGGDARPAAADQGRRSRRRSSGARRRRASRSRAGSITTDWGAWAKTAGKIQNGDDPDDGPDAFDARRRATWRTWRAAGMNAYRFSIEMARFYPTRAAFDADKPDPDARRQVRRACSPRSPTQHVTPLVDAPPLRLAALDERPVAADEAPGLGAERRGERLRDLVRRAWPSATATASTGGSRSTSRTSRPSVGYLATLWPPGVSDVDRAAKVMKQQVMAHAACFDAMHATTRWTPTATARPRRSSIAQHQRVYEPIDPTNARRREGGRALRTTSGTGGSSTRSSRATSTRTSTARSARTTSTATRALKGRADYLGINYYGVSQVNSRALQLPVRRRRCRSQLDLGDGRPKTDLGWSIYPEGFVHGARRGRRVRPADHRDRERRSPTRRTRTARASCSSTCSSSASPTTAATT